MPARPYLRFLERNDAQSSRRRAARSVAPSGSFFLDDARAVERLRATTANASEGERPTADVIALVNRVLAKAGVPTNRFAGCAPEGDAAVGGNAALRRQSVRLTLHGLTIADLGAFLGAWRDDANPWTPGAVEVNHPADAGSPTYDAQVVPAAVYHAGVDAGAEGSAR